MIVGSFNQWNDRKENPYAVAQEKPSWDPELRELRMCGVVVKRFARRAVNQERILAVFEEEGWPYRIDDPLLPTGICPKARLRDTVKHLNRQNGSRLIRFGMDGTGEGVIWRKEAE
jgi:hypothetical protein